MAANLSNLYRNQWVITQRTILYVVPQQNRSGLQAGSGLLPLARAVGRLNMSPHQQLAIVDRHPWTKE